MQLQPIKIALSVLFILVGVLFFTPQVEANAPDVHGFVYSSLTNAPIVGVWVKWSDRVGGYRYARTNNNGEFVFPSWRGIWDSGQGSTQMNTWIDTDLNGSNDDVLAHLTEPATAPYWNFSCGSDPHIFTVVSPVTLQGTFTSAGPININNGNGDLVLSNIIFTPAATPTPTPVPVYTVRGNVFEDKNANGIKDNGEVNYSGTPVVTASRGTVTVSPGGLYTITNVTAGSLTISTSVPSGYSITSPRNGPPPSFSVNVGPSCNTNGAPGASCQ